MIFTEQSNQGGEVEKKPKFVTRAVMLCKDPEFQIFIEPDHVAACEDAAKKNLYRHCGIRSRAELACNKTAQEKLMDLERRFNNFKNPIDEIYKHNLEREF